MKKAPPKLTDAEFNTIEKQINTVIHELVFAAKHAEDDQLEDAAVILVTVQETLNLVADKLVAAGA